MEKIKLEEFLQYKYLSSVQYAPDGAHAAFVVHEAEEEENKYLSNIWVYDTLRKRHFQLTTFQNERSFIWLQDSEHLLFSTIREEKDKKRLEEGEEFTKFYTISILGGEAKEAFCIPRKVRGIKQIDENTFLFSSIFNATKVDLNTLSETEKAKELKKRKEEKDYEVLDEIPFWGNGEGFTNKNRTRLFLYHKDTKEIEPISGEYMDVESYNLNKEKDKLVFTAVTYQNKMPLVNAIYLYDLSTKAIEQITPFEQFSYGDVHFMTEHMLLCTGNTMEAYGINENSKFYTIDLQTGARKCITPDFEKSTWNSVGSDVRYGGSPNMRMEGEYLYFITTEGDSSYVNRMDAKGNIEKIIGSQGSVDGYDVNKGNILFIALREQKLQELYTLEEGKEIPLSSFNEWVGKKRKVGKPEKITIETAPGVYIDGWILKPVDFNPNEKYPAILDIHGGPKTVYSSVFYHEMQYWANEGYVVFFCNPRGSDGKGNDFADIRGKYGTIDYEDIMKFTDTVLERCPFIDEKRVGVTGGSYGGFMTNWIIGHTDRFAAAASQRSISNWISKFCTTDIGYYFVADQNAATPWNDQEKLWEHSPLKYADQVTTPTLFIHSEEDYRCWLVEGIQMYTALKYHNVESRLVMFRGENHELSRSGKPKHRIRRLKEITEWFNYYLK